MKKKILQHLFFLEIAACIIFTLVIVTESLNPKPQTPSVPVPMTAYTLAQVAGHGTAKNCWTVVRGNVYDVTLWIDEHPGGAELIIKMCGHDSSSAFIDQHNGQPQPESELASFKIGILQ